MNLSEDVFEPSMSTGSGLFSFLSGIFAQIFRQIVSMIRKRLRNTNLVTSIYFKMKKTSLPVDERRSKTPLLKFPSNTPPLTVYYKRHHCLQTLFLIFKFVRGEIKKLFVSRTNVLLVGTLISIGDVSMSIATVTSTRNFWNCFQLESLRFSDFLFSLFLFFFFLAPSE